MMILTVNTKNVHTKTAIARERDHAVHNLSYQTVLRMNTCKSAGGFDRAVLEMLGDYIKYLKLVKISQQVDPIPFLNFTRRSCSKGKALRD